MGKKSKADKLSDSGIASPKPETDWESEGHANDLMRAGEVIADPTKMKKAMKHIKKKKMAIRSIGDLQKFHNAKFGSKGNPNLEVDNDVDDGV